MEIIITIIGVLLGFSLSEIKNYLNRNKRSKTSFKAIKAEIELCSQMAEIFLKDKVAAPLYRLPMNTYNTSLSQLLSDSYINDIELRAIQQFYVQVESFNRGLDQAASVMNKKNELQREYSRNVLKAKNLISTNHTSKNLFVEAHNLLQKRCK